MQMLRAVLMCLVSLALGACGGGGGNPGTCFGGPEVCGGFVAGPTPGNTGPATGLFRGTTSDGKAVTAVVLSSSQYWFLYGTATDKTGLWQGAGSFSLGNFTSNDLVEIDATRATNRTGTANGTYVSRSSLSASINVDPPSSFTAAYDASYEVQTSTTPAVGNYAGSGASAGALQAVTFAVASGGALSGATASGCQFSGTLVPDATFAFYAIALTFTGVSCPIGMPNTGGIAFIDGGRLHVATLNIGKSNGFIISAGKT